MKPAPPKGVRVPIDNGAERRIESMMVSIDKLENDKLQRKGRKSLRLELWAVERLRRLEGRDEKGCPRLGRSGFFFASAIFHELDRATGPRHAHFS